MSGEAFPDHFSSIAASYARYRPTYPPQLFDWIASVAPARDSVWDCACGSGQATFPLADRFAQVTGTDASAEQLQHTASDPRITWKVAPAEASGLDAASMDAVTVAQALHWFDLPRFWAEVRRVLKPRGLVVAWSYGVAYFADDALTQTLHRFHDGVLGSYWPVERGHVDQSYATINMPFERLDPPPIPMSLDWTLDEFLGYLRTWSATRRYIADRGVDPITAFGEQLAPAWGERREVLWPLTVIAGRAGRVGRAGTT